MGDLILDFQSVTGKIKPLHGVNNGPVTCNFRYDATTYFKKAGIPFSRLHDTEYPFGSGQFVDINCIFPNFERDPEDPQAYNFALTDEYLQYILKADAQIIYRLGCTIEHQRSKRHVFPPSDYEKWAHICEHIIRHYNEGWAGGFSMGIQYWEIWNEPDGMLWEGPKEEYFSFFKTVVTYLKSCYPHLYFGGPALCTGCNEFSEQMFRYLVSGGKRTPVDFYSWHTYACTPEEVVRQSELAHELLVTYGYTQTESILDEWNYVETWDEVGEAWDVIQSMKGAAFNGATMILLQDSTCDKATYYDAQLTFHKWWNGMFAKGKSDTFFKDMQQVVPKKGYYPFEIFGKLYGLGNQVYAKANCEHLYVLAASDGFRHAVMLANYQKETWETVTVIPRLVHDTGKASKLFVLDETHDLELVQTFHEVPEQLEIRPNTVLLWEF